MSGARRVLIAGAGVASGVVAAAALRAARALRDDDLRRDQVRRSLRIWRLTARRGVHYAAVKVRGAGADAERKAELERHFAVRTAEDAARELGQMKGALMKAGQLVGFIAEGLPPEAQRALAQLQADVPPMSPSLAASVVRAELGDEPERVFLDWEPEPRAAASIGQVHRAVTHDGRIVAVKVMYPGADTAILGDLANAELLYRMFSAVALPGLDVKGFVEELRTRMRDELDYTIEARNQTEFVERHRGHPFVHVPAVVPELSTRRVLTSHWVDGWSFAEFLDRASPAARQRAGETLFRFAQRSVFEVGVFNGDPQPGNYKFRSDGTMTFLDFGLVKRWAPGEWERLRPSLDAILARDPERLVAAMVGAGFLPADHGLAAEDVFAYVSAPYEPYLTERFRFTRAWVADTLRRILDIDGPSAHVIRTLNMPPSFVILDRVVWGVSAILGKLEAEGPWRGIILEYLTGAPPCTPLGEAEAAWAASRRAQQPD